MKIGIKEDIGAANEMALLVLGSRARSARNFALRTPEHTYSHFMVARSKGLQ